MKKYNRKVRKWLKRTWVFQSRRENYGLMLFSKKGKAIAEKLGYLDLPF